MKKIIHLLLFTLVFFEGNGQVNLVPNPSFEDYNACPNQGFSEITMLNNWTNPNEYSPDYFNACDTNTVLSFSYDVPGNTYGNQMAKTGEAYIGLITLSEGVAAREYVQAELNNSLEAGKLYCVSFFVSASDKSKYVSNDIGIYFSSVPIIDNSINYLPYSPQIFNISANNPLINKTGWTEVSGNFTAQGGENFIVIGNFKSSEATDTNHFSNCTLNYSYHYIDDVSVTMCDEVLLQEFDNQYINVHPNPFTDIISVNTFINEDITEIVIYDLYGNVLDVFSKKDIAGKSKIDINTNDYPNGIYLFAIRAKNKFIIKKLIKK